MPYRLPVWLFSVLLLMVSAGCGNPPAKVYPATSPVSGSLLVDGVPAIRARIVFHPVAPGPDGKVHGPSASTDDNGSFRLTTFSAYDGAPPGEYKVTIVAEWVDQKGVDVGVPDLLKGRYRDPKTTPLTITVKEGENDLEQFDLKSESEGDPAK